MCHWFVGEHFELIDQFLGGTTVHGLRVEEVEPPESGDEWRVTLSYLDKAAPRTDTLAVLTEFVTNKPLERVLRVIVVDGTTLEPKKMKIRE